MGVFEDVEAGVGARFDGISTFDVFAHPGVDVCTHPECPIIVYVTFLDSRPSCSLTLGRPIN